MHLKLSCSQLFLTTLILVVIHHIGITIGLRVRLNPEEEPDSESIYNNLRTYYGGKNLFILRSAGLLKDEDIKFYFKEDVRDSSGKYPKASFDFNSSHYIRKGFALKWFVPYEERVALHVYDNAKDRELAAGPQVNQKLCGLELEYMLHMIKLHYSRLDNVTDYSIYSIMGTYGAPGYGITKGNNIFPGSYKGCIEEELSVLRRELVKVDRSAAESYFKADNQKNNLPSTLKTSLRFLKNVIGPFFGYARIRETIPLEKYKSEIKMVPMKYCIARLRWPSWNNNTHFKRTLTIETGTCLPNTCDSNSFNLYGDKIKRLVDTQISKFYSNYYISDLYCLPDKDSPLRNPFNYTTSIWFIVFNVIWFMLIATSTFIIKVDDKESPSWKSYLEPWRLSNSVRQFISPRRNPSISSNSNTGRGQGKHQVNMDALEGFKVLSAVSVITSHCIILLFTAVSNPTEGQYLISQSWIALSNLVCPSIVDNFFVVTGIITALTLFQMPQKVLMSFSFWAKFIIYRYIRIIPLYLFIHWFLQSFMRFLGSGPFWDYGTSYTAWSHLCQQESWWNILIPQANFMSPAVHCLAVGWYLANDIFFSLFTPIIIIIYLKKPTLGHVVTIGAALAIMFNHISYYYYNGQDPRSIFEWSIMTITRVLDDTTAGYVNPQFRSIAFFLGIAAGHILNEYRKGAIKSWPKPFLKYGKIALYFMMYLISFGPFVTTLIPLDNEHLTRILASIFEGSLHAITSVASVIFILLLCTGYLPLLQFFYSRSIFKQLASVGLSTLLIHIPLIFYRIQTYLELPALTFYHVVMNTLVLCVESFVLAIALYLIYELPMRKFLFKIIFSIIEKDNSSINNSKSHSEKSKQT